ncbi:MAG: serine/threonine-protein kinase [Planctomycetota bacterium]
MADESDHQLIDELADEFLTKCLRGAEPDIESYCAAYPWLAEEIRMLFPMLQVLESNKDLRQSFSPPDTIGRFRIVREIGRGGMAVVYEAFDERDGSRVALKFLLPDRDPGDAASIARFEREAKAVAKIEGPGVVRLIEFGNQDGLAYLAMQLIDGTSLDRVVRLLASANRSNPGQWMEPVMRHLNQRQTSFLRADYYAWVAHVGKRMANALDHAHASDVLHRDVKPSNVLIDGEGEAWLTDFGLAKMGDAKLTRTGQIIGTLRYLAPERLHGECDARADIYGLGLVLYELLAFRAAFVEVDRLKLIAAVEASTPISPRQFVREVPPALERIVMRAIARLPSARYQSAKEMAEALDACNVNGLSFGDRPRLASLRRWFRGLR